MTLLEPFAHFRLVIQVVFFLKTTRPPLKATKHIVVSLVRCSKSHFRLHLGVLFTMYWAQLFDATISYCKFV